MAWQKIWTGNLSTARNCPMIGPGNKVSLRSVIVPALSTDDGTRIRNCQWHLNAGVGSPEFYYTRLKNDRGQEVASEIRLDFTVPAPSAGFSIAYGVTSCWLGAVQAVAQAHGFQDAGLGVYLDDSTVAYKSAEQAEAVKDAAKAGIDSGVLILAALASLLVIILIAK